MAALPDELIDTVSLFGPKDVVRERLRVYRDAGVGTLGVTPLAFTKEERLDAAAPRGRAALEARLRVLLGAFGDPGHAFPIIALGRALRAPRPRRRCWRRGRAGAPDAEREGLRFAAAPEYHGLPHATSEPLKPYEAVVRAVARHAPARRRLRARRRRRDILTLAPALAAELEGVPVATLIPHVDPRTEPGWPPYSHGRAAAAHRRRRARLWRALDPLVGRGLEPRPRRAQRDARAGSGWRRATGSTTGSRRSSRSWRPSPSSSTRGARAGPGPTSSGRCCGSRPPATSSSRRATRRSCSSRRRRRRTPTTACCARRWRGLAGLPVRVLATWNRRPPAPPLPVVPPNARLVEWVSYARTMPRCDVVVCHGGHGTVARALEAGCVVVAAPAAGDMNENAARLDWAGLGVRLPRRFVGPRAVRLAAERALASPSYAARAAGVAAWARSHDAGARAAELVEELAARGRVG